MMSRRRMGWTAGSLAGLLAVALMAAALLFVGNPAPAEAQSETSVLSVTVYPVSTTVIEIDTGRPVVKDGRHDGPESVRLFRLNGFTCGQIDNPRFADPSVRLWHCTKEKMGYVSVSRVQGTPEYELPGERRGISAPGTTFTQNRLGSKGFCDVGGGPLVLYADTIRWRSASRDDKTISTGTASGSLSITRADLCPGGGGGMFSQSGESEPERDDLQVSERQSRQQQPTEPVVSIAGGAGVSEGGNATFTLTASPAPYQALTVAVTVADPGDFASGGQAGSRTITLPTTGSVSFSVGTDDDSADEADGTITATLSFGTGYTVGSAGSATVAVSDNDDAPVVQPTNTALEAKIQERIDKTAQNGDDHSNRIWRGALAAVRGEQPTGDAREVDAAFAQRLSDNHGSKGRAELSALWQEIADALNGV